MLPLPPWPPASNVFWARVAITYNALFAKCQHNPLAVGALANLYMESALRTDVVGDNGTAYNLAQWHQPRIGNILAATGIDVRTESSIPRVIDALWWELNSAPYAATLAQLLECQTVAEAASLFCAKIEGAGAVDAAERRALAANHLAVWVAENGATVSASSAA